MPAPDQSNESEERLPPYDTEAELGCLACILQASDEAAREWLSELSLDSFYDERNREIYRAIVSLNGSEINVVSVHQWLADKNRVEDAGGQAYVIGLPEKTPSASFWPSWYDAVENCRIRRSILRDATELARIAQDKALNPSVIADAARRMTLEYSTGSQAKTLSVLTPDDINAMQFDDSDRILGDRMLARGQPMVIAGAGSIGKSRLAFQLCACCVAGTPFISLETRGENLRWLFLQAENSNRRLQNDLQMLKDWLNPLAWQRFNNQVLIHTLSNEVDYYLSLSSQDVCNRITALIRRAKPDIIVWDSLYNFAIDDINTDEGMANTLLALSRLSKTDNVNVCNVVLHHAITGKIGAAKATGYDRSSFGRNSKVLHSWTRGQINVAPGSSENNESIVVSCGKCSNGQEFPPFAIRLNTMSMIYDVDTGFSMAGWQDELRGKEAPVLTAAQVAKIVILPMPRNELRKRIMEAAGVTSQTANRYIRNAIEENLLTWNQEDGIVTRNNSSPA